MATLSRLIVQLDLADGLSGKLSQVSGKVDAWGKSLMKTGGLLTAGVTTPIVLGLGKAIQGASDLAEAQSATNTIFGKSAKGIQSWATTTADAYGISNTAALDAVNVLGQLYKGTGLTTEQATKFGMSIVNAAGDLASFYNADPSEVLANLQSGLVGQYEPLRKYGIVLSEAAVQQRALADTGKASADQLTEGEKVAARQALILEGLGDAAGDASRTQDGLANSQRRLKARLSDLSAQVGQILLPTFLKLVHGALQLVGGFQKLSPRMQQFAVIGALIAAAIGPVVFIIGALVSGIALLLSPIALVVIAVGALAYLFRDDLANAFRAVVDAVSPFVSAMAAAFGGGVPVSELVKSFPEPLQKAAKGFLLIADAIGDLVQRWQTGGFGAMLDLLPDKLRQVGDGLKLLASEAFGALKSAIAGIDWGAVWDAIVAGAAGLADRAIELAGELGPKAAAWLWDAVASVPWAELIRGAADLALLALEKAGDLAAQFGGWLWDAVAAIPWGELIRGAADLAVLAIEKAGDLASEAAAWLAGAVENVEWLDLIADAADLAGKAVAKFGDLAGKVVAWVAGAARGVPWTDILTDAADLAGKAVTAFGDLGQKVAEWVGKVRSAVNWDGVFQVIVTAFTTVTDAVNGLDDVIATVASGVSTAATTISDALKGIWDIVSGPLDLVKGAIDGIVSAAQTAADWLGKIGIGGGGGQQPTAPQPGDSGFIGPVMPAAPTISEASAGAIAAIAQSVEDARTRIDTAAAQIIGIVSRVHTAFTNAQAPIQAALDGIATAVGSWVANVGALATAGGDGFNANASQGFGTAVTSVRTFLAAIQTNLGQFVAQAAAFGTSAGSQFNANLSQGFGTAVTSVRTFLAAIQANMGGFVAQAAAFGTAAGNEFALGLATGMNLAVSVTATGVASIRESLDSIGSQYGNGYDIGYSLGQGINAGIGAWVSAIAATAAAAVAGAITAARNAAEARSPSRKMMRLGGDLGEGLVLGLHRAADDVADAARGLIPDRLGDAVGGLAAVGLSGATYGDFVFNIQVADDPETNAQAVWRTFQRELALREGV